MRRLHSSVLIEDPVARAVSRQAVCFSPNQSPFTDEPGCPRQREPTVKDVEAGDRGRPGVFLGVKKSPGVKRRIVDGEVRCVCVV